MKIRLDLNKLGPIQKNRWRITYHEIGHIIAHIHYKFPFDYVTIVPTGTLAGHVKSPDLDEGNLTSQQLEMRSVILLAGEAIDRRLFGRHAWHRCGGKHDFRELYRLHKIKCQPHRITHGRFQSKNYFFHLCRKACFVLNQYEKEIHLLAYELKKRKTLTYDQVCDVLCKVDQVQFAFKALTSRNQQRKLSFEIPESSEIPEISTFDEIEN